MLTESEFDKLSSDLRVLAKDIPLHWGAVQNNRYDGYLSEMNFFRLKTYDELENAVRTFPENIKLYFRRRWYIYQCAKCDEYLFGINSNVHPNPNVRDKSYDISFDEGIEFDVKGTVIPQVMRRTEADVNQVLRNPFPMICFYYDKQSRGRRFDMQNRLFIVHHSFVEERREFYLRCAWGSKRQAYHKYSENIRRIKFHEYQNCKASVLFILERVRNQVEWLIDGLE